MTYTLQELEAMCAEVKDFTDRISGMGEFDRDVFQSQLVSSQERLRIASAVAIPELITRIKDLDPDYNLKPSEGEVERAMRLSREAGEKRAKLAGALEKAKMGSLEELNAMNLEALFAEDGSVQIRQKQRQASP